MVTHSSLTDSLEWRNGRKTPVSVASGLSAGFATVPTICPARLAEAVQRRCIATMTSRICDDEGIMNAAERVDESTLACRARAVNNMLEVSVAKFAKCMGCDQPRVVAIDALVTLSGKIRTCGYLKVVLEFVFCKSKCLIFHLDNVF